VLEIDGVGHLGQDRWYDDLLREAELVLPSHTRVIRLPAAAIRHEPVRVIAILSRALGVDRAA
jgi:very-short-patch-repair endonuclease